LGSFTSVSDEPYSRTVSDEVRVPPQLRPEERLLRILGAIGFRCKEMGLRFEVFYLGCRIRAAGCSLLPDPCSLIPDL
jgi:hypothetical protein